MHDDFVLTKLSSLKGRRGKYPIFEGAVREVEADRFQIDAFRISRNGERERVPT